jgi:hypothetical protein
LLPVQSRQRTFLSLHTWQRAPPPPFGPEGQASPRPTSRVMLLSTVVLLANRAGDLPHLEGASPTVSPYAKIATWRYWFRLSRDVFGGNRSFAS